MIHLALAATLAAAAADGSSMQALLLEHKGHPIYLVGSGRDDALMLSSVGPDMFCVDVPASEDGKKWVAKWCYPLSAITRLTYTEPNMGRGLTVTIGMGR